MSLAELEVVQCCTDSIAVLYWIQGLSKEWKLFIKKLCSGNKEEEELTTTYDHIAQAKKIQPMSQHVEVILLNLLQIAIG